MELKIQSFLSRWVVTNKEPMFSKIIYIPCDSAAEAMNILQAFNGQPYEVIDAFHKTRERLG